MFKKLAFLSPTLLLMAMSINAKADVANSNDASSSWGRAQFSAAEVSGDLGVFSGDVMLPLYSNSNGFAYGDAMGDYGTDATYLMSPGVGYRGIFNNQIFGAYAFTDYEKTNLGENFWVLSPGVEWISPRWDAHVNLYFPTNKIQEDGAPVFADTLNNYEYQTFVEDTNDEYGMQQQPYAVIGNGADAEIGYSFSYRDNLKSRVYLGSYYYQPPSDTLNILGETLGYQQAFTENLSFTVANSYDEVNHYAISVGVTMVFGGNSNKYSTSVQDRLLDPVERHVGIIDTGAGTYDQQTTENRGMTLEYDNVVFTSVNPTGSEDGTYGNSAAFTQDTLDDVYDEFSDGARIYVQGGSDAIYTPATTFTPYAGQDFYGRTTDYTAPAATDDRPEIDVLSGNDGFQLTQGGENTFSDLYIHSLGASSVNTNGIYVRNSSESEELTINNTTITGFARGAYVINNAGDFTLNLANSQFNENGVNINGYSAYGMSVENHSSGDVIINVTNSQFNNNSSTTDQAAGLYVTNTSTGELTVNAVSSQFNGNSTSANNQNAYGIYAGNSGSGELTVNASNSTFNANQSQDVSLGNGYGLYLLNNSAGEIQVAINNSEFNSNTGATSGDGMSVNNANSGGNIIISAINSEFNNNSSAGMYVDNSSTIAASVDVTDLSGSNFNDNGLYGIYNAGSGTVNGSTSPNLIDTTDVTFEGNGASPYNW